MRAVADCRRKNEMYPIMMLHVLCNVQSNPATVVALRPLARSE